jgi:ribosomal protein S18 acetylase RimI-like enzyme
VSDGVRIRPLEAADIPELLALARDTWHAHYPSIITLAQIEYMLNQRYQPELISADLDRSSRYWDVLERLGRLMAFAQYEPVAPGECKLDKLYVRHDARHQGFGSRLLAHVEREARALGATSLWLQVNRNNAQAIAAYRRNGFDVAREVVVDIGGGFMMDDFVMSKDLGAPGTSRGSEVVR